MRSPPRPTSILWLAFLVSGGCDRHTPDPPPPGWFTHRWVWDSTVLWLTPIGDFSGAFLVPGRRLTTGYAVSHARAILQGDSVLGYVPESLLHRTALPSPEEAYRQAGLEVLSELLRPQRGHLPPADSGTVIHRGRGSFEVRGTLVGEDWEGNRRAVPWTVWLRRLEYRWVAESLRIGSSTVIR